MLKRCNELIGNNNNEDEVDDSTIQFSNITNDEENEVIVNKNIDKNAIIDDLGDVIDFDDI